MGEMVPKGPRAGEGKVRDIDSAPSRTRGRPSGLGYDPATGEEVATPTLERTPGTTDPDYDVFVLVGQRGYSEDRFYTKSSDQRGHSKMLRVWLPQGIDSQVYGAVNDVPQYRTVQDFMRDAVVHRLEYLQKRYSISDEGRRMLELERLRADSERRANDIALMQETVRDLGEKLETAYNAEDYGMLAEELREGDELIDWLREPYRTKVKALLADWNQRARTKIMEYRASIED